MSARVGGFGQGNAQVDGPVDLAGTRSRRDRTTRGLPDGRDFEAAPLPSPVSDSEPLSVSKLEAEFPETYRAGQRFTLVCLLNRPVHPYEERLLAAPPFQPGRLASDRHLHLECRSLDNFSVTDLHDDLQGVSDQADSDRREAEAEKSHLQICSTRFIGRCATGS